MNYLTIDQASELAGLNPAVVLYHARHGLLGPNATVGENPYKPTGLRLTREVKRWLGEHTSPGAKTAPHKRTHLTKTHPKTEREYVTVSVAAKRLGFSRRAIYYHVQQKKIPGAIRIAGNWRIRIDDLNQYLTQLHAERGEQIDPVINLAKPRIHEAQEVSEFHRRMMEYLIKPYRFSRPISELRRAVEDGTATDAEIAEVRTWDFWRAWDIEKPTLSPALRDRFNKRAITAEDLATIRLKVSRSRRS